MIKDLLKNAEIYHGLNSNIGYALEYLNTKPLKQWEPGKYEIQGTDMFLLLLSYETRSIEDGFWEAHRTYIDIQYMLKGAEKMGHVNMSNLTVTEEYSSEKDIMMLEGDGDFVIVREGEFAIFFPEDAHMPCLSVNGPESIKKAVIKIRN